MSMTKIPHRLYLTEDQMPKQWFNLRSAMPQQPDPLLNPATLQPLAVDDLSPIFCEELARQELDGTTAYVDIPEPIQEVYKMYRPSPLIRAYELEKALGTPARIYYKFEGNNTSGSHKLNSAVRGPGLLRQKAGPDRRHHRDRGRPVGHRPFGGLRLLRADLRRVYGQVFL